jgi:hypothetical protein
VAERYGLKVFVVANSYMNVPRDPRILLTVVSDSFDAADNWIAERVGPDDIVVTADIPLADRCLKAGAAVMAIPACRSPKPRSAWRWPIAS